MPEMQEPELGQAEAMEPTGCLTPALKLRAMIEGLPADTAIAGKWLTQAHASHKAHWLGWLAEYDSPGYYGRSVPRIPRSMAYIYGHIHCGPMLLWLAEAAGVDPALVEAADLRMRQLVKRGLSHSCPQIGISVRQVIPWRLVETALNGLAQ